MNDATNGMSTESNQPQQPPDAGPGEPGGSHAPTPPWSFGDFVRGVAAEHRATIEDALALSETNDPFWAGATPSQQRLARWFADLWERLGKPDHAYVRGIHYAIGRLHRLGEVQLPFGRFNSRKSGKPFHNVAEIERAEREHPEWKRYLLDNTCYDVLGEAAAQARYTGLVPMEAIEDHRTPPPVLMAEPMPDPGAVAVASPLYNEYSEQYDDIIYYGFLPRAPERPDYGLTNYHEDDDAETIARERRNVLLELWCEKSDPLDWLEPLCQRHGINFVYGIGELSTPAVQAFIARVEQSGRSGGRILYISDLDQMGILMARSIAAKVAFILKHRQEREGKCWLDIGVHPIALTRRQARELDLVDTEGTQHTDPAKLAQQSNFTRMMGFPGKIELNELDPVAQPDVLEAVIEAWVAHYRADALPSAIEDARTRISDLLDPIRDEVYAQQEAAYQAILAEHQQLLATISKPVEAYRKKLLAFDADMREALEQGRRDHADALPDFPDIAPPDDGDTLYFHSGRSYWEQLQAYKTMFIDVHGLTGDEAEAVLMTNAQRRRANQRGG